MNDKTLKPCPFCGEQSISFENFDGEDREGWPCRYVCCECGTEGPWACCQKFADGENEFDDRPIIKLWNDRPYEDGAKEANSSIDVRMVGTPENCEMLWSGLSDLSADLAHNAGWMLKLRKTINNLLPENRRP